MNTRNLKLVMTMVCIILFASCKSSEAENKNGDPQRRQGSQPSVEQLLTELDTDNDGKLSMSEVKGPLKKDFSKIDSDDDGYLSKEELKNAPKPNRQGPPNGSRQ